MWLLSTARAELHEFIGPEAVPGGFAILSHVWGNEELSFKDLKTLCERCKLMGENPRDRAHPKIRRFCERAESWGHEWAWADMCCIDKSSSSELSEAINSMYRYYSLAEVCYAYLSDVHPYGFLEWRVADADWITGPGLSRWEESFKSSTWHTRGWTLQELIAPSTVIFLSKEWDSLGAKADLASLLHQSTGIPEEVFTLSKHPTDFSIAQRMSWAARRMTTRPEDEAYCLMGLFDVHMPTLYGEGYVTTSELTHPWKGDPPLKLFFREVGPFGPYFERSHPPSYPSAMFKSRVAANVAPENTPDDAMKHALLAVVQVWLDRLQQQAVVTTFFVSIDSLLFSLTSSTRSNNLNEWSNRDMVINASLGGAIIFHVCAGESLDRSPLDEMRQIRSTGALDASRGAPHHIFARVQECGLCQAR
ncbi:heterokaryon incompatibility protein-domain-containing protein [Cerioporus squamosus]|nr:heterokaryon incompatibility protein-domain-containing protein [Cerioporus squamosus]